MTASTDPPLDVLKPIGTDVRIVDSGPRPVFGMPLPVRMRVVGLADGGLRPRPRARYEA